MVRPEPRRHRVRRQGFQPQRFGVLDDHTEQSRAGRQRADQVLGGGSMLAWTNRVRVPSAPSTPNAPYRASTSSIAARHDLLQRHVQVQPGGHRDHRVGAAHPSVPGCRDDPCVRCRISRSEQVARPGARHRLRRPRYGITPPGRPAGSRGCGCHPPHRHDRRCSRHATAPLRRTGGPLDEKNTRPRFVAGQMQRRPLVGLPGRNGDTEHSHACVPVCPIPRGTVRPRVNAVGGGGPTRAAGRRRRRVPMIALSTGA